MGELSERERLEGEIRLKLFQRFMWASPRDWLVANVMLGRLVFWGGLSSALFLVVLAFAASSALLATTAAVVFMVALSGEFQAAYYRRRLKRLVPGGHAPDDVQEPFNAALASEVARRYRKMTGNR